MLKHALIVCGATLLLAGSGVAGTSDTAGPGNDTHMQQPPAEPGSGRQPGHTPTRDQRGTGDAGTLGSGATGEDVLDADKPAEQCHQGEQCDAEGNPTGRTPSGMIQP